MKLLLSEPAQRELDEAMQWYAEQAPGLGEAFLLETLRAFDLMQRHPTAGHPMDDEIRRWRLSRFPYAVVYAPEGDALLVLAIAHLHRRPAYWRTRWRVSEAGRSALDQSPSP